MYVSMKTYAHGRLIGQRHSARRVREQVLTALQQDDRVELDFSGLEATQSFADELIGSLVLTMGPQVLQRLAFSGCTDGMKKIITFVVRDRAAQHLKHQKKRASQRPIKTPTSARIVHA